MATASPANLRAFVRRHTRLVALPDLPGVRLHLAEDVADVTSRAGRELEQPDPPFAFWAFAWAGGLALGRHLVAHPEEVAGRRVLDIASGSGLCAIAALRAGAVSAQAIDIDPLSQAAVAVNARANAVRVGFTLGDPLDTPPPDADVILAGDVCYEEAMADRMLRWLHLAARRGARVLVGDPGRTYLPSGLQPVGRYTVHTSRELESKPLTETGVYTIAPS
jgi:predicted nicotinamide N-methyase